MGKPLREPPFAHIRNAHDEPEASGNLAGRRSGLDLGRDDFALRCLEVLLPVQEHRRGEAHARGELDVDAEAADEIERAHVAALDRLAGCVLGIAVSDPDLPEMNVELGYLDGLDRNGGGEKHGEDERCTRGPAGHD
jgi:hypothetical protein